MRTIDASDRRGRATTRATTRREKISIADDELTTDDDDDDDSTTTRAVEMTSDDNRDVFDADVDDAGCDSIESASDSEAAFASATDVWFTWRTDVGPSGGPRLEGKAYSDAFQCGDTKWRLMMFPCGNTQDRELADECSLSLFLDTVDRPARDETLCQKWSRACKFELQMIHPTVPEMMETRDATHAFQENESDWGFTTFIARRDMFDKGYVDGEGKVTFRVHVMPCEAHEVERATMSNSFYNDYDSRKETGLIGLKNQGATCYMNSLLQTLYHIPSFRRAVYHMPTDEEQEAHSSMPLALQSVFYCLQYAKHGDVATEDLTRSFGWDSYDSFMQHDVQELNRVLQDKLEEQMKQTTVEGTIQKLFEGHTVNFIQCINVDYKSERKEAFLDLQLDVKGCKDIYASFDRYTETENLDGENKYRAEGHGLQDARKGTLFHEFPPVLQIQLKRFEYDFHRDTMVKIHDRYEFPEELDLDVGDRKYLVPEADKTVRNKYKLHSVLVHSGGINGGHYYAFIRPELQSGDAQWYKFDDEHVTKETKEKAVMDQYGSGGSAAADDDMEAADDVTNVRIAPNLRLAKVSSAYMLVYIRESDMDEILCEANAAHLTEHLQARFAEEQKEKERQALEKAEAHLYTVIKVLRQQDLHRQSETEKFFDLGNFNDVHRFRLPKKTKFGKFKARVAEELGVPIERQRYWLYQPRRNKTTRPADFIRDDFNLDATVENMRIQKSNRHSYGELRLYLEDKDEEAMLAIPGKDICLHLKVYDPHEARLSYRGAFYADGSRTLSDYLGKIKSLAGFAPEQSVELYEEIAFVRDNDITVDLISEENLENNSLCEKVNDDDETMQLGNGDILIVQPAVTDEMEDTLKFPNVRQFIDFRHNHQVVLCRELNAPKTDQVRLELTKLTSYDQVAEALADALQLSDPKLLRFTSHNIYTNGPKSTPFKFRGVNTLAQMLDNQQNEVLYYDVVDIPLPELEQLKDLQIYFHGANTRLIEKFQLRLPKDAKVQDVLEELRSKLGERLKGKKLRLLELFYSQIYKVFDTEKSIADINEQYWTLRAEEVPEDEDEDASLLRVYNISKDLSNPSQYHPYDEPFLLRLLRGETLGQIKARIKDKLEASDDDFAKWKFHAGVSTRYQLLEDDDMVLSEKFTREDKDGFLEYTLGIERDVKGPRRPASRQGKASGFERAIKIM